MVYNRIFQIHTFWLILVVECWQEARQTHLRVRSNNPYLLVWWRKLSHPQNERSNEPLHRIAFPVPVKMFCASQDRSLECRTRGDSLF